MAFIRAIRYYLPSAERTNDALARLNPAWDPVKIYAKTGIRSRRIAAEDETATDLGYRAAQQLLDDLDLDRAGIDTLIFCTESPDYPLPPSACLLQSRLGLSSRCGAFDINLGCSGFTYGLWLAKALIASDNCANVLLVTGDTYSKYCCPSDMSTATIFGDGAAATLITNEASGALAKIGATIVGTDGSGAEHLIVQHGGARNPMSSPASTPGGDQSSQQKCGNLAMNGPAVFAFTLTAVTKAIKQLIDGLKLEWEDIDRFLFHQANAYMLERLRRKMNIPAEKMPVDLEQIGNTVSATIPILIQRCLERGTLQGGQRCILAGFGVGFSWAVTYVDWLEPAAIE